MAKFPVLVAPTILSINIDPVSWTGEVLCPIRGMLKKVYVYAELKDIETARIRLSVVREAQTTDISPQISHGLNELDFQFVINPGDILMFEVDSKYAENVTHVLCSSLLHPSREVGEILKLTK